MTTATKTILVTGGLGYIGSHCSVVLIEAGYQVIIVDNLDNSTDNVLKGIESISGTRPLWYNCDIRDGQGLDTIFAQHTIDAVIHFAAKKAVGESMEIPFEYYDNNVIGTKTLLEVMDRHQVRTIIFSSTCAVYSANNPAPYTEIMPTGPESVYGITKRMCEEMMEGLTLSNRLNACILRYFNPIGNHASGMIGEDPRMRALNIMPVIMDVLIGNREYLSVFGNDYDTKDGTCIRDYIHVMDLVEAHVSALERLLTTINNKGNAKQGVFEIINLGTGQGSTVLDMITAVNTALNTDIPYRIVDRRDGDLPAVYGDCSKAQQALGRTCKRTISQGIKETRLFRNNKPL